MNKGSVVAYNNYDRLPFDAEVDSKGRFSVNVSDFPVGTEFFLQGINSKGVIKSTIITLEPDTFPPAQGFSYIKPFARIVIPPARLQFQKVEILSFVNYLM